MIGYIVFVDPKSVVGVLTLDNGLVLKSHHVTHSSGRPGIGFDIPDDAPNGNGAQLVLTADGYYDEVKRGILWLDRDAGSAFLEFDDFRLIQKPVPCPDPEPEPIPDPSPAKDPLGIINEVYKTGKYKLSTKEGCGEFTEECCNQLHDRHSKFWGHIQKFPPQNCWPPDDGNPETKHHAVDAIMLMVNDKGTEAGIYDIILDTESDNAEPQFIKTDNVNTSLWYYPA